MDDARFDQLTKFLTTPSRRSILAAGGTLLAGLLERDMTATAKPKGKKRGRRARKRGGPRPERVRRAVSGRSAAKRTVAGVSARRVRKERRASTISAPIPPAPSIAPASIAVTPMVVVANAPPSKAAVRIRRASVEPVSRPAIRRARMAAAVATCSGMAPSRAPSAAPTRTATVTHRAESPVSLATASAPLRSRGSVGAAARTH